MKLSQLIDTTPVGRHLQFDPEIKSVHYRSQEVKPGGLFVAVKGLTADGHDYIDDAVNRGALAIMTQKPVSTPAVTIQTANTRKALASVSAAFYGYPSRDLCVIAVTGTNGKTSTAYLTEGILSQAGFNVGVIGTINYRYSNKIFESPMTTPESLDLQKILFDMKSHGITHVVMEVSSHGIDLFRVDGCWFDAGVFTNLSQDHLDYHKNMENYWACKKRLFTEILTSGSKYNSAFAVIHADDSRGQELLSCLSMPCLSFGQADTNPIRADQIQCDMNGIRATIYSPAGVFECTSSLVGRHNLENILAATSVGIGLGISPEVIRRGIESVQSIPGRLQRVSNDSGRQIYVDYAHTPDALKNVLTSLTSLRSGKIICVFGCGGDRDRGKRPIMGEIAATYSDLTVVTSDNPRTEPPMAIIDQIVRGVKRMGVRTYSPVNVANEFKEKGFVVEPDRHKAIRLGILTSKPGDTLLIAGKGHETCQTIGKVCLNFNDFLEVRSVLEKMNQVTWLTSELLAATGGKLACGDPTTGFSGICIDSRKISPGDFFVAIVGQNHDGHQFIDTAIDQGIQGVMVRDQKLSKQSVCHLREKGIVCIIVSDTKRALGDLAAFHRSRSNAKVVAITGSNGKTTTREMTTSVLSRRFRTLSTIGNFNNDIGLPLTLFRLNPDHEWAVLELGTNHPGEIKRLAEICQPDIGVITNIGPAHLEGLGSLDGVMHAKGELLEQIHSNGTAVLNADDAMVRKLGRQAPTPVLFFGFSDSSEIRGRFLGRNNGTTSFLLILPEEQVPIDLPTPGVFMVSNALAAAAVGHLLGLSAREIKEGLEHFMPVQGRMNIRDTPAGVHIIDDSYNANPASMAAAIHTLQDLRGSARGFFVAGDMHELGVQADVLHRQVGAEAARSKVTRLYATGRYSESLAQGAIEQNMGCQDVLAGTLDDIFADLVERLQPGDWVLIKGSRAMGMESLVTRLMNG